MKLNSFDLDSSVTSWLDFLNNRINLPNWIWKQKQKPNLCCIDKKVKLLNSETKNKKGFKDKKLKLQMK